MKKTTPLSFKKNFSWGLFGNLIYALTQSALLILVARLDSPESVGKYTLALAVIAPIYMFIRMQLNYLYATDINDSYNFSDYMSVRLITSTLMVFIIIIMSINFDKETGIIIIFISIAKYFESLSDLCYGVMQRNERIDKVGMSKIIRGILTVLFFGILLYVFENLAIASLGLIIAGLMVLLLFDLQNVYSYQSFKPRLIKHNIINIIKIGIPLAFVQGILSLNTNMPRYFVEFHFGATELGYFGAVSYLVIASVNPIANALTQSTISRMAKYYNENKLKEFSSVLKKILIAALIIAVLCVLGSVFLGDFILTILFGVDYANYTNVLIIMMISTGFLFTNSVLGSTLTSMKLYRIQPILGVLWTIKTLILCFYLVPSYGLKGAAFSVLVSSMLQTILRLGIIYNKVRTSRKEKSSIAKV